MTAGSRRVRVRFDEQAFAEDLARLSPAGREACFRAREGFEREGVPVERLRACTEEHQAGTSLPGCLKVYVPGWDGRWRIVFQIATDESGALLSFLAAGVAITRAVRARRTPTRSRTTAFMGVGRAGRPERTGQSQLSCGSQSSRRGSGR